MSQHPDAPAPEGDLAPGERKKSARRGVLVYLAGYALALGLTGFSFWVAESSLFWQPGVTAGLLVLAAAQMGIHLMFFLHLTSGPDNTNNALAVAFGVLIIVLVGAGSLWIMANLNANMMPMETSLQLQR